MCRNLFYVNKTIFRNYRNRKTHGDLFAAGSRPHFGVEFLPAAEEIAHGLVGRVDDTKTRHVHTPVTERTKVYVVHTLPQISED